jgi:S1-C subfamily serine protease
VIQSTRSVPKGRTFLHAIARPGNSGGPIVGENGTVIGIVSDELCEESIKSGLPFYAGVPTVEIARAVKEICPAVEFPIEDYT